jgi:fibronectin-binding autotransporter adhesin
MNRQRIAGRSYLALGVLLAAAVVTVSLSRPASAAVPVWIAGDGNWSVPGNWSTAVVPAAGDQVKVFNSDGVSRTIIYDYTGPAVALTYLSVDLNGGTPSDTETLSMSANNVIAGSEFVGNSGVGGSNGSGTFNQSGGTNTISVGQLGFYLGYNATDTGFYNLGGGTLSANFYEIVGHYGTGNFNQSGGTNISTSTFGLFLGNSTGSNGTYILSGTGALSFNSNETVGFLGTGTFNQTAGTNTISGGNPLIIGSQSGSNGTYTLSGGSAIVSGSVAVGGTTGNSGGTGLLTVSGTGVLTVGGTLITYNTPGSGINLSGGTINTGALNFNGVSSLFNWTTGILNLTSDVTFDSAAAGTTTSAAFGPSLILGANQTLMITGNETVGGAGSFSLELGAGSSHVVTGSITLNPTGVITQDVGSSLVYASFNQNGGTVNGAFQNLTTFTYNAGLFNGRLFNQGTASFLANFTAGLGMENDGRLTVTGFRTLTFNGPGLDNFGSITLLAGQTITGVGVVNDVGGVINSAGTIATNLTNFGTLTDSAASGLLLVTGPMLNYGNVGPIASGVGFRPAGGLDNFGTVQLNGGSISGSSAVTNDFGGLIQSGVGTSAGVVVSGVSAPLTNSGGVIVASSNTILNLTGFAGGNIKGGQIRLQDGALLDSTLAFPNSGTIVLQGPGARLTGGAITNTGTIQGAGTVGSQVLNTTGVIRATGGELDLAGTGNTNASAAQIQAGTGNTVVVLQGLATNSGTIALSGGTFDNNSRPITNDATGFVIGSGTFRSGGLTNNGTVRFADNPASVYGSVTTAGAGSVVNLINNTTTFYAPVTIAADSSLVANNATARFLAGFTGSVTSGLANNGAAAFAGVNAVYGTVANAGAVTVGGGSSVVFNNQFSGSGSIVNSGTVVFNTSAIAPDTIGGALTNNPSASFVVNGDGSLEIDAAPTLANASSISVNITSRLKLNVVSGSATIGTGVTATVSDGATLELAGSVSALANGSNRVNIINNSSAPGILVSGTNQVVGNIDGSGST